MKNLLLLLICVLLPLAAAARQLSTDEAIARIGGLNKSTAQLRVVSTISDGDVNLVYMFHSLEQGLLVSADDCAPALLGVFDIVEGVDSLPSNVQAWVNHYASLISTAIEQGVSLNSVKAGSAADVSPLLSTTWNQSAPYNNDCVQFDSTPSVTGCVATAMAQIMNYHKHPQRGTGSHSYSYKINTSGGQLTIAPSADFGATTYNWDNMLDSYSSSYTAAQAQAVSTLMYHCGVSVDMIYKGGESSASSSAVGNALISYFGYDKGMTIKSRDFYSDDEWVAILYSELAADRPVYYSGSTASNSGHAFVCDGYRASDGFFHINWGWGGYCDGYFTVLGTNALDPNGSGIGGGNVGEGFNVGQTAIVGIRPDTHSSEIEVCMVSNSVYSINATSVDRKTNVTISGQFMNYSITSVDVDLGVKFVSATDDTKVFYQSMISSSLTPFSYYPQLTFTASSVLENGTYYVYPIFRATGSSEWQDMRLNSSQTNVTLTVTGEEPRFTLTKLMSFPKGNITTQSDKTISFTIKALQDVTNAQLVAFIFPAVGGSSITYMSQYVTMTAGQEKDVTMTFSYTLTVGNSYEIILYDYSKGVTIGPESSLLFSVVDSYPTASPVITISPDDIVDVYTIGGVKVKSDVRRADALSNLVRGVYVVGGVKCIVK
ncbi:MAG: C10 family peptidase [Bacteroidia bacterium]|nr:C10 family peptidase [Bacteroidia bacterium]